MCSPAATAAATATTSDAVQHRCPPLTRTALHCTKPDARPPRLLSQALVDRSLVLTGLDECLSAACARIRAIEPTDGRWVAGRWVSHRGKEAVATASTLRALIDAERVRGVADSTVWLAAAGGAHPTVGEPSAAAVALTSHLKESAGPLAQLGAASPLLRTIGWTAASLADAGVDGGECCGAIVHDHALRWTLLGDACDVAYARARAALEDGATSLSLGGALADVECAIALREAQTSSLLLFRWVDEIAACDDGEGGDDEALLQAARGALDKVEPGYVDAGAVAINGYGWCDTQRQLEVRGAAASSYTRARRLRGGCQVARHALCRWYGQAPNMLLVLDYRVGAGLFTLTSVSAYGQGRGL